MVANARRSSVSERLVVSAVAAAALLFVDQRALADDKQVCADSYAAVPTLRDAGKPADARKEALECARACGGLSAAAQEFGAECTAWAKELEPSLRLTILDASGAPATGATITIDGKPVSDLSKPVRVAAGKHVVHAELAGSTPVDVEASASDGATTAVDIRFMAAPVGPTEPVPTEPVPGVDKPAAARPIWPAVLGFGLAGAGLAVGIGTLVAANADPGDDVVCPDANGCQAGTDFQSNRDTLSNVSLWSFVSAGVVAGASTGLLIWAVSGKKSSASALEVPAIGLVVARGGWAISAAGSF